MLALPHLLATCLPSLWTLPFPCFRFDFPLSHLTIWCFGQTALFLFFLAKTSLVYLPTALSVALRPLFPFQRSQYVQVFSLKPAPFCTLFSGLGSTSKSLTSLLLLSDSRSVLDTLSSSPSFLLPQSLWQIWQELSSLHLLKPAVFEVLRKINAYCDVSCASKVEKHCFKIIGDQKLSCKIKLLDQSKK